MTKRAIYSILSLVLTACLSACLHQPAQDQEMTELIEPVQQAEPTPLPALAEADPFAAGPVTNDTIWAHIVNGYQLEGHLDKKLLQTELNWYSSHKEYIDRVMRRSEPFLHYILTEAEKRNLPTELVLLPIVESAFQPFAYSHGRAAGIWQFIPATGRLYGLKQNWWYDGRRDIYSSTQAALKYLENLNKLFDGDWLLALAAYNSGSGTVQRAIRKNRKKNKPVDFWHLSLPLETRTYVPKLLALKELIRNPQEYEITLRCIPYAPGFKLVESDTQIDLALAAELADIDLDTLYSYNPAYNRWATPPNGPHTLLLPAASAELFETNLDALPEEDRIRWKRHRITQGQTLSHIAVKYNTTVKHLKKVNNIHGNNIRAGKYLIIPVASRNHSDYKLSAGQRKKTIQNSEQGQQRITHIVKSGESFWLIARKYGVSMHKLAKWNGMAIRDTLREGQRIVIWKQNKQTTELMSGLKPSNSITSISYTVRNGDSLSSIASKYNVSVNDLHQWNTIKGKYLQPGQRLKVYIDITEQAPEHG